MKKRSRRTIKPLTAGQKIYVGTHLYLSEGSRDVSGGLATVTRIYQQKYLEGIWFVEVKEHPGHSYNWTQILSTEQAKLKKEFGKQIAHADPDIDRPWIEPGDTIGVDGDGIPIHATESVW